MIPWLFGWDLGSVNANENPGWAFGLIAVIAIYILINTTVEQDSVANASDEEKRRHMRKVFSDTLWFSAIPVVLCFLLGAWVVPLGIGAFVAFVLGSLIRRTIVGVRWALQPLPAPVQPDTPLVATEPVLTYVPEETKPDATNTLVDVPPTLPPTES